MKLKPILVIAAAALFSTAAFAQSPIVIKFSHVVADDTPKGKAALEFKRLAETATGGKVKIEVYANSTLYKDKEEMEALQLGAVQMLAPSLSKFGPLGLKQFEVFDLPFIFDNYAEVHKITDGPVGKKMLGMLESKGLHGLAFWDNGLKIISANKPLRVPNDAKGLKFRIQPSAVSDAQMRAMGALPQKMAFSEVYQALQTGVVDGQDNTPSNTYTQKFHEVQKYVTLTDHSYLGYAVIVNKKFWDGLPADIRGKLETAMAQATKFGNKIAETENDEALAKIVKSGKNEIIKLSPEQKKAWKQTLVKVHEQMADRVGKDTIQSVYKELGFDPANP